MSLRALLPYIPPPTRLPVPAPRCRGLIALGDGRCEMAEAATVSGLYEAAEALGGELVEVSPGAAPGEALRWPAA